MTSKISFFKMVLNDSKRRLWLFIILLIGFLIVLPLAGEIYLSRGLITSETNMRSVRDGLRDWLLVDSVFVGLGITIGSVLSAFSGFRYLYKRTKLDVFHSIPIKREKLFLVQYVSGLVLFAIPFLIGYFLMMIVCAVNGALTSEIAMILVRSVGLGLLHFIMYYNVAILAIMLTGKIFVGIMGMMVMWGYMPLFGVLINALYERFFYNYYITEFGQRISDWFLYSSPVTLHIIQTGKIYEVTSGEWTPMIFEIIIIIATLVGSLLLYLKRPSEVAESSMAFPKTMPVIKILLMVLVSIGNGLFLGRIVGANYDAWFFFGIIMGLLLSQGVIAVVYTGDIRKILSGKKSLGIAIGIVLLVTVIFRFDLFGYDSYVPNPDRVESVGISIDGLNDSIDYPKKMQNGRVAYFNPTSYRLEHGQVEDIPAVYEIVANGIQNSKSQSGGRNIYNMMMNNMNNEFVVICFKLDNGRDVYRRYNIDISKMEAEIAQIYSLESFKEIEYPILKLDSETVEQLYIEDVFSAEKTSGAVKKENYAKILTAYQEDLQELKFGDIRDNEVIGIIRYGLEKEADLWGAEPYVHPDVQSSHFFNLSEYPIYPSCHRTVDVLRSLGYKMDNSITTREIEAISFDRYDDITGGVKRIVIRDENEQKEILACQLKAMKSGLYKNDGEGERITIIFKDSVEMKYKMTDDTDEYPYYELERVNEKEYLIKVEDLSKAAKEILMHGGTEEYHW